VVEPAIDLGRLLLKHPAQLQSVSLAFGTAHVFYPKVSAERCTAALLLEVDPVGLVRGWPSGTGDATGLSHSINDRPYAASSFLSAAIGQACRRRDERRGGAGAIRAWRAAGPGA
jgi:hypothetical protein